MATYTLLKKYAYRAESNSTDSGIREEFFFKEFANRLMKNNSLKVIKVFPVPLARMPILKIKYKDVLNIDLSFALVGNADLKGSLIAEL